jgi:Cyclin, C-terminal domain/Cyclin, N-terminal domain
MMASQQQLQSKHSLPARSALCEIKNGAASPLILVKRVSASTPSQPATAASTPLLRRKRARVCSTPQDSAAAAPPLTARDLIIDIDAAERDDAEYCTEYQASIASFLRESETKACFRVAPDAMRATQDSAVLTCHERDLLVNWLCSRCYDLHTQPATLHAAVSILNRALAALPLETTTAAETLTGACLHLAIKLEESVEVPLQALLVGLNSGVTAAAIIAAEAGICAALHFALSAPTAASFLPRALKASLVPDTSREAHLAAYLADLSLTSTESLAYRPSRLAAAAVCLALRTARRAPVGRCWSATLAHETGLSEAELTAEVAHLAALHRECEGRPTVKAFFAKYGKADKGRVSHFVCLSAEELSACA